MRKIEIMNIRLQVHNAFKKAWEDKVPFSLLLRKEWQSKGYIPVPAMHTA